MPDRILIVEDESKLAALLRDYLVQEGFDVSVLHRGDEVEAWVAEHEVDLVLLDLLLPGKNGLDVCRALRARDDVAIIMSPPVSRRSIGCSGWSSAPTTTSASPSARARSWRG